MFKFLLYFDLFWCWFSKFCSHHHLFELILESMVLPVIFYLWALRRKAWLSLLYSPKIENLSRASKCLSHITLENSCWICHGFWSRVPICKNIDRMRPSTTWNLNRHRYNAIMEMNREILIYRKTNKVFTFSLTKSIGLFGTRRVGGFW